MGCKKSKIARASENPDNTDPSNCTPAEKQQRVEARHGSDAASHAGWTPFIEGNSRPDAYRPAEWDEQRRWDLARLAGEYHVDVAVYTWQKRIGFNDYRRHRIPRGTRYPCDAGVVEFDIFEWIGGPHIPPAPDVFW